MVALGVTLVVLVMKWWAGGSMNADIVANDDGCCAIYCLQRQRVQ